MDVLVDTNILVRRINRQDPRYREARVVLKAPDERGDRAWIVPQNVVEFWSVCTRPAERNGFGLDPTIADRVTARIESGFHLLPETHEVYSVWRNLVVRHSVLRLRAYDARLVAAAIVHKVGAILTFNDADFRRFPEVKILHTNQLVSGG